MLTRFLALLALCAPLAAFAQVPGQYPNQTVRVVVGFPPDGTTDVIGRLIAQPALVQRFAELGAEPLSGTPDALAAFVRTEQDKWGRVIRDLGIKLQ